jgi:hypothetical protein
MGMNDIIGWIATAVTMLSFLCVILGYAAVVGAVDPVD